MSVSLNPNLSSRHLLLRSGDQPCSLGYGAHCVCTQTLCRGSSVKKTSIQEALRTTCSHHTLLALCAHTLQLRRLTAGTTADTHTHSHCRLSSF